MLFQHAYCFLKPWSQFLFPTKFLLSQVIFCMTHDVCKKVFLLVHETIASLYLASRGNGINDFSPNYQQVKYKPVCPRSSVRKAWSVKIIAFPADVMNKTLTFWLQLFYYKYQASVHNVASTTWLTTSLHWSLSWITIRWVVPNSQKYWYSSNIIGPDIPELNQSMESLFWPHWWLKYKTSITVNLIVIIFLSCLINYRADVVLLCFSIADSLSLQNVKKVWMAEIKHFCPRTPIILCGTKNDLRTADLAALIKERGPVRYVRECNLSQVMN